MYKISSIYFQDTGLEDFSSGVDHPSVNLTYLFFCSLSSHFLVVFQLLALWHLIFSMQVNVDHMTYFHDAHVYCLILGQDCLSTFYMFGMWLKNRNEIFNIFRLFLCRIV